MADQKRKSSEREEHRPRSAGDASKGQYGSLKGLGPGGGGDIEEALDAGGIDREDVEATKK